mgnify:CR=1 FL=1
MKGILHNTDSGWQVSYSTYDMTQKKWLAGKYPLHPEDVREIQLDSLVFDNIEARIAAYPDVEFVKVDDSIIDYEQLVIMSCCNHNIMANSSYSWWGSYLNEYKQKIVCFPSKWFGEYYEHMYSHKDMMHDSWVRITSDPIHWTKPLA